MNFSKHPHSLEGTAKVDIFFNFLFL